MPKSENTLDPFETGDAEAMGQHIVSVVDMAEVLKNANPLYVQLPSDASEETKAALTKLALADIKR